MSKPQIPKHIDRAKVPKGCYWQAKGQGRWYTSWRDETGRQRTKTVGTRFSTLADLHTAMEAHKGRKVGTLTYLIEQFEASAQFRKLAPATRRDYEMSAKGLKAERTKAGVTLGDGELSRWSRPMCQRLIDRIARERGPSAANHALRYLKRLFRWGINRGYLLENHAKGVEAAEERKLQRCPDDAAYNAVLAYAMECGGRTERTKGSCAPYLWPVMELAYLLRLRGVEVLDLSDASATADGVIVQRRKGSRGNVTEWAPRVKAAWAALESRREAIWERRSMPFPIAKEARTLVVAADGEPLQRSSLSSSWDRFIKAAISAGVIQPEQRFSLHDLKRRGISKTAGGWDAKREASGHKSDSMRDVYDKSTATVRPVEE